MKNKKIGILGGTFDPIHNGHINLAEAACKYADLSEVLLMPTFDPYYKKDRRISSFEDRLEMTRLACIGFDKLEVSDFEREYPTEGYTVNTLKILKEREPWSDIFFIIGGDSLFSIEMWKDFREIFSLCTILVGKRENEAEGASGTLEKCDSPLKNSNNDLDEEINIKIMTLKEKYDANIFNIYSPGIDISSSGLRSLVKEGMDISRYVPERVFKYIQEHCLYV